MAQFTVPLLIGSTLFDIYSKQEQARAIAAEKRQAATTARIDAQGKEIERRRRLLATISAQNNAAGASGLTPGDQFTTIQENDLSMYDLDILTAKAQAATTQSSLNAQAGNAERMGTIGGIDTALKGAYKYSLIA